MSTFDTPEQVKRRTVEDASKILAKLCIDNPKNQAYAKAYLSLIQSVSTTINPSLSLAMPASSHK